MLTPRSPTYFRPFGRYKNLANETYFAHTTRNSVTSAYTLKYQI